MFNVAIFVKALKNALLTWVGASLGIVLFTLVFSWAVLNMGTELMEFIQRFSFLQKIMEMAFGIDVSGEVSTGSLLAVIFTHAMILIMSWAAIIAVATANTIGEFESGTADLLLTLPVSRTEVYVSNSVVLIVLAIGLGFCPMVGLWIATFVFEIPEPIFIFKYVAPSLMMAASLFAVGGITCLCSMILPRRTYVIATVTAIGIYSMLVNFVEPFVESLAFLKWTSLMNYFRPVDIYRADGFPLFECLVLLGVGVLCWFAGLMVFQKKEIPTG